MREKLDRVEEICYEEKGGGGGSGDATKIKERERGK